MRLSPSSLFVLVCMGALSPTGANAQLSQAGDRDPSGRILARVIVTLAKPGEFGHPVAGLRFVVVAENGDRTAMSTDAAGVANVWLNPGTYRFVTPDPVAFEGKTYSWDTTVPVRPGGAALRLSQGNAVNIVNLPSAAGASTPQTRVREDERQGLWFNAGIGYGAMDCKDCEDIENGVSGGVSLGATVTPRVLVGVGASFWSKSENSRDLTVTAFDARVRLYPSIAGGLFVNGGVGFGTISSDLIAGSGEETGFGGMLGMGFDFRLGTAASITPFVNGVFVQTDSNNASFGQIGIGITFQRTRRAGLLDF